MKLSDFTSVRNALLLKELGFSELVMGRASIDNSGEEPVYGDVSVHAYEDRYTNSATCLAVPANYQITDWLRIENNISILAISNKTGSYGVSLKSPVNTDIDNTEEFLEKEGQVFSSYEDFIEEFYYEILSKLIRQRNRAARENTTSSSEA